MFLTYLRRELRRRRKAALVVASGLALGIALVIVVTSVTAGMQRAQDQVLGSLYGLGTDLTVTKARSAPADGERPERPTFDFDADEDGEEQSGERLVVQGLATLDAATVTTAAAQDGVARAAGGLSLTSISVDGQFRRGQVQQEGSSGNSATPPNGVPGSGSSGGPGGGSGGGVEGGGAAFGIDSFTVYGTDVTADGFGPLASSALTEGRAFTKADADAAVAVVDSGYAQQEKLAKGDKVTVGGTEFTVVGIATADSGQAAADVYLPLKRAQTLADAKDKITTVYVQAADSQQLGALKTALTKKLPGTTVTSSADLADTVSGSLSTAASLAGTVGRWLSWTVLAAAFLVAGLLTTASVGRRVREFGTLKALGWRSGRVTRQIVGEAVANGLIGGVLGIAVGLGAAYAITAAGPTLTAQLGSLGGGMGGGMGRGPGSGGGPGTGAQSLDVALTAPVSATTLALAVGLAVAGGLVAGAFGGWRASRLRPADALRRVE
ncbi:MULTISPECIES: ABC transporter permease [Streptomyces]|uniref:FtsX-like permease family protein n=1 Tax=Streptomyces odorifer TaxID=53450 RepID=A0A7Y6C5X1_9ACTN|nr:ABC transporter permease [Streptomyces odorifer]NUV27616.1 FtsX-like permease family protein [Streptomyces odorifer]NUV35949.1 FtsX-like permease family protein [Streptomyces sp. KAI-27]NUV47464.1 FtsX-like permease family protein [Streptomyces sp. CAI-78]